jgi:hypothetical protein
MDAGRDTINLISTLLCSTEQQNQVVMAALVSLAKFSPPREATSFFVRRCSSKSRLSRRTPSLFPLVGTPITCNSALQRASAIQRLSIGASSRQNRFFSSSKPNNTSKNAVNSKAESSATEAGETATSQASMTMWQRFLAPKPMPERHTAAWYRELLLICTVFGITGSSTMLVRFVHSPISRS